MVLRHISFMIDDAVVRFTLLVNLYLTLNALLLVLLVSNIFGSVIMSRLLSFTKIVGDFLTRFSLSFFSLDCSLPVAAGHEHIDVLGRTVSLGGWVAIVVSATSLLHLD